MLTLEAAASFGVLVYEFSIGNMGYNLHKEVYVMIQNVDIQDPDRVIRTLLYTYKGVVGCGEGVVYLTSPGCPADIGLQLGKACYPCSK